MFKKSQIVFDKVFKKFSRLENHLTSTTQGNGLGLYITKQLVENMSGQISFTSEINKDLPTISPRVDSWYDVEKLFE